MNASHLTIIERTPTRFRGEQLSEACAGFIWQHHRHKIATTFFIAIFVLSAVTVPSCRHHQCNGHRCHSHPCHPHLHRPHGHSSSVSLSSVSSSFSLALSTRLINAIVTHVVIFTVFLHQYHHRTHYDFVASSAQVPSLCSDRIVLSCLLISVRPWVCSCLE